MCFSVSLVIHGSRRNRIVEVRERHRARRVGLTMRASTGGATECLQVMDDLEGLAAMAALTRQHAFSRARRVGLNVCSSRAAQCSCARLCGRDGRG
jgi:hypothetical protein